MCTAIEEYKKSVIGEYKQNAKDERDIQIITNILKYQCAISTIEKYTQLQQEQIIQIARANYIPLP